MVSLLGTHDEHAKVFLTMQFSVCGGKEEIPHQLKVTITERASLETGLFSEYLRPKELLPEFPISARTAPPICDGQAACGGSGLSARHKVRAVAVKADAFSSLTLGVILSTTAKTSRGV